MLAASADAFRAAMAQAYQPLPVPASPSQQVRLARGEYAYVVFDTGPTTQREAPGRLHASIRDADGKVKGRALVDATGTVTRIGMNFSEREMEQLLRPAVDQIDPELFVDVDRFRAARDAAAAAVAFGEWVDAAIGSAVEQHRHRLTVAALSMPPGVGRQVATSLVASGFTGSEDALVRAAAAATELP